MPLPHAQFKIQRVMAVVALLAVILWLIQYPGGIFFSFAFVGLVLASISWSSESRRAPSTAFLSSLIGVFLGFLLMPAKTHYHPTNDFRDYLDLFWLVGGAAAGALVGTVIGWLDRRITAVL